VARNPGLLALGGAVLLMCAPVFPGLSRLVVLPALLLAPGYALLRLLGQATGARSISVAVPVSLVLAICASLVLNASGIRLAPLSLGLLLGAATALFLAGSYGRQLVAEPRHRPAQDRVAPHPPPADPGGRGHVQLLPGPAQPSHPVAALPATVPLTGDTDDRGRTQHVSENGTVTLRLDGRVHRIGIGRKHAGTPVLLLVQNSRVRISDARTGELLSELILDPQGQHQATPPGDQEPGQRDAPPHRPR
jgi:hypothetical protein